MVLINTVMGTLTAYVLVRYQFPGKSLLNALVDLPLAIPTLVTGVMLVILYGPQQPIGAWLGRARWAGASSSPRPASCWRCSLSPFPLWCGPCGPGAAGAGSDCGGCSRHAGRGAVDHLSPRDVAPLGLAPDHRCAAQLCPRRGRVWLDHHRRRQHPAAFADGRGLRLGRGEDRPIASEPTRSPWHCWPLPSR